jgi:hypothetical protein
VHSQTGQQLSQAEQAPPWQHPGEENVVESVGAGMVSGGPGFTGVGL